MFGGRMRSSGVASVMLLLACSSETNAPPAGPATCESVNALRCTRACACGGYIDCRFAASSDPGATILILDNESDCRAEFDQGCSKSTIVDWESCRTRVANAQCIQTRIGGALLNFSCSE
jgi:hypothetical protein